MAWQRRGLAQKVRFVDWPSVDRVWLQATRANAERATGSIASFRSACPVVSVARIGYPRDPSCS
jgi:hypothetical protein